MKKKEVDRHSYKTEGDWTQMPSTIAPAKRLIVSWWLINEYGFKRKGFIKMIYSAILSQMGQG